MTQFTVTHKKGLPSTVTVSRETIGKFHPVEVMNFVTDQSLTSQSDRAWEVEKAIKEYAHGQGFRLEKITDKFEAHATYDPGLHSHIEMDKIREQVKADPEVQELAQELTQKAQRLNQEHGRLRRLIRNLTYILEQKNRRDIEELQAELVEVQNRAMAGIEVPPVVNDHDRKWLNKPFLGQIETLSHYRDYGVGQGELPGVEELIEILGLVKG